MKRGFIAVNELTFEYLHKKAVEFTNRDSRRWTVGDIVFELTKNAQTKGGKEWN